MITVPGVPPMIAPAINAPTPTTIIARDWPSDVCDAISGCAAWLFVRVYTPARIPVIVAPEIADGAGVRSVTRGDVAGAAATGVAVSALATTVSAAARAVCARAVCACKGA